MCVDQSFTNALQNSSTYDILLDTQHFHSMLKVFCFFSRAHMNHQMILGPLVYILYMYHCSLYLFFFFVLKTVDEYCERNVKIIKI